VKPGGYVVLAAAARLYAPLLVLLAGSLLVTRAPGSGVGVLAGLVFGLALALHALVFGAAASRKAFPPVVARAVLAAGVLAALTGAPASTQWAEAGLFLATSAALALILAVLFARAPTLSEAEW
jgi:multisubunit Na+/H+ antiporter MnhB subunit